MSRTTIPHSAPAAHAGLDTAPIVVGVDGGPESTAALDWAAGEARLLGRPLHLVHVHALEVTWPEVDVAPAAPPAAEDAVLGQALARVTSRFGEEGTVARSVGGNAAEHLVLASASATEVVVGAPHLGLVGRALVGSTAIRVAAAAHCPVVVVRDGLPATGAGTSVVVGCDGSPTDAAALRVAFARAERLGLPLAVVHAWHLDYVAPALLVPDVELDRRLTGERARLLTEEVVARWAADHPGVEVQQQVVHGDPVHVLANASIGAESVVVGSHGHTVLGGLLLGSVSQGLLRRAACPVVVVRPDAAGAPA
ncbi:universal stress protein [Oryzobacter sp. R7]|uniref:universal stress protein n=1 Tax=Oryzobacter faecalis TaxID=3388656 RepID=UPI00398CB41D